MSLDLTPERRAEILAEAAQSIERAAIRLIVLERGSLARAALALAAEVRQDDVTVTCGTCGHLRTSHADPSEFTVYDWGDRTPCKLLDRDAAREAARKAKP